MPSITGIEEYIGLIKSNASKTLGVKIGDKQITPGEYLPKLGQYIQLLLRAGLIPSNRSSSYSHSLFRGRRCLCQTCGYLRRPRWPISQFQLPLSDFALGSVRSTDLILDDQRAIHRQLYWSGASTW